MRRGVRVEKSEGQIRSGGSIKNILNTIINISKE